ncbi:unnamed protein product [Brassica oleracea]
MNFLTGAVKAVGLNRQVMERLIGSILFEPTKVLYRLLLYYLDFFVLFYFPLNSCSFVNSVVIISAIKRCNDVRICFNSVYIPR